MTSVSAFLQRFLKPAAGRTTLDNPPKHVAIIMDGNGRWARRRGLLRLAGHRAGAKAVRNVITAAAELGVKYITLYTFSSENWRRPRDEVSGLMSLFEEMLAAEIDELDRNGVRLKTIGDLTGLKESTRQKFEWAAEKTAGNQGLTLVIAVNYSGRADLLQAVRALAAQAEDRRGFAAAIDEATIKGALFTADIPDPELIIRTSGEMRLSNFLIWESAYSEFWTTKTLWPDFTSDHFAEAIAEFERRERRFGRVNGAEDVV